MSASLVGSEMCIRDRCLPSVVGPLQPPEQEPMHLSRGVLCRDRADAILLEALLIVVLRTRTGSTWGVPEAQHHLGKRALFRRLGGPTATRGGPSPALSCPL
eukprot:330929-Alexandrium_andersonii.AAC.1